MAVGASTEGQNNSWRMADIYGRGAQPVITPYQKAIQEGRREGGGGRRFNADTGAGSNNTEDGEHLDGDQRLREWGWDPDLNRQHVPGASQTSMIGQPARDSRHQLGKNFNVDAHRTRAESRLETAHFRRDL